jgi:hypothetical protein
MKRTLLALSLVALGAPTLRAQDAEGKAVLAVVEKLFDGMKRADTAAMRTLFAPQARMMRVNRQGQIGADSIDGWLRSIGRSAPGTLIERTWAHEVRVDATIAQAWMKYDFHVGERFSHCGVDAFDFMKVGGEWKIVTVMDTSANTGCTPPPKSP